MPLSTLDLAQVQTAIQLHHDAAIIDAFIIRAIGDIVAKYDGKAIDKRIMDEIRAELTADAMPPRVENAHERLGKPHISATMDYDGSTFKIDTNWYRPGRMSANEPGSQGGARMEFSRSREEPRTVGKQWQWAEKTDRHIVAKNPDIPALVRRYNHIVKEMEELRAGLEYPLTQIFADH